MAEFKGLGEQHPLLPHEAAIQKGDYTPYGDGGIDNGGLAVLGNGQIVEVRNPKWSPDEVPEAWERSSLTQLRLTDSGVTFDSPHLWNSDEPTQGDEIEISVYAAGNGRWPILPDGVALQLPNGTSEPAAEHEFQPEALTHMIEYGTAVSRGPKEHEVFFLREAVRVENFLEQHGLVSPPVSSESEDIRRGDISGLPYIQMITSPEKMPHALDFVASMSEQHHVQMLNPEAGAAGLTYYQAVQAVLSILTQSAPARDGRLDTTLGQHYTENTDPEFVTPPDAANLLRDYGDHIPADWREFARTYGSPSGGVYKNPAQLSINSLLDDADKQIRSGEIVSASRVLGWHTDRLRFDIGTLEVSNMGRAGGNYNKQRAVHELVAKFFVGMQTHFDRTGEICPELFDADDTMANRQTAIVFGQENSKQAALFGKSAELVLPDGTDKVTVSEMLGRMIVVADTYNETPISPANKAELFATLGNTPTASDYAEGTAEDVYTSFYRPESPMTAAEAIHLAAEVEPSRPLIDSLKVMGLARREHIRRIADAEGIS